MFITLINCGHVLNFFLVMDMCVTFFKLWTCLEYLFSCEHVWNIFEKFWETIGFHTGIDKWSNNKNKEIQLLFCHILEFKDIWLLVGLAYCWAIRAVIQGTGVKGGPLHDTTKVRRSFAWYYKGKGGPLHNTAKKEVLCMILQR